MFHARRSMVLLLSRGTVAGEFARRDEISELTVRRPLAKSLVHPQSHRRTPASFDFVALHPLTLLEWGGMSWEPSAAVCPMMQLHNGEQHHNFH
jgi:hypothetical protein